MFSLAEGISLEDSKMILRWGSSRTEAWKIGKPSSRFQNDETRIQWEEKMLGGLSCGLLAYLPDDSGLNEVSIWLKPKEEFAKSIDSSLFHYCTFFDHIFQQLGAPIIKPRTGSFYAPILTWQHDGCFLQLVTGERHGDYTILEITRGKAPRYPH